MNMKNYESTYKKFGDENLSIAERVQNRIDNGENISGRLFYDICNATPKELSWDLFYQIIETPQEKETGYWLSAKVASILLTPIISKQFIKNKNDRVHENVNEDFMNECIMEIARVLPDFDKEKSHFPNFIAPYIKQVGYVHGNDLSVYMANKTGFRVFSQDALSNKITGEDDQSKDPYFNTPSDANLEEEVNKREGLRRSGLFSSIVVEKSLSGKAEREKHRLAITNSKEYSRAMALCKSITESAKALDEGATAEIGGISFNKDTSNEIVSRIKSSASAMSKSVENDKKKTLVNATIWKKFLGGIPSYPEKILDAMAQEITDINNIEKERTNQEMVSEAPENDFPEEDIYENEMYDDEREDY